MNFVVLTFLILCCSVNAKPIWIIDETDTLITTQLSVQVCSGLFNRNASVSVYTVKNEVDSGWLDDLKISAKNDIKTISSRTFLQNCFSAEFVSGYIRYDFHQQRLILPNLITVAAVLNAIPMEEKDLDDYQKPLLIFDALVEFHEFSALDATSYVYEKWVDETTAMAKMNPGLYASKWTPWKPKLERMISIELVDFIVKEKLFNFFLWFGCIPGTKEHELMKKMAVHNPWPNPIPVYGYDDSWVVFGGDVFEAETNCVPSRNMGTIASAHVSNLAYLSTEASIQKPLKVNPSVSMSYDKSKTYIAFVIGDGDNISFVKTTRKVWMKQRVEKCQQDGSKKGCFPLLWSLSPHLLHVAPDIMNWYYEQALLTKQDHFVLPPSGDLYAYPGMMPAEVQANFVKNTEKDCELMNTNAVVGWEWMGTWGRAFKNYFPRYSKNNIVQAIFSVNVPYLIPILSFPFWDTYRIVNENLVVFKPREWRGTDERKPKHYFLSSKNMAKEINQYKRGTVTHIYTTSDGEFNLQSLYDMVAHLDSHVEIVDSKQLVDLALQRSNKK